MIGKKVARLISEISPFKSPQTVLNRKNSAGIRVIEGPMKSSWENFGFDRGAKHPSKPQVQVANFGNFTEGKKTHDQPPTKRKVKPPAD